MKNKDEAPKKTWVTPTIKSLNFKNTKGTGGAETETYVAGQGPDS